MESKHVTVILLSLVAIGGIGWGISEFMLEPVQVLPPRVDNWTEIFHGYEAYLDNQIFYSTVSGTSMAPTIKDGDVVLWVKADPAELEVGDIIVYQHPTQPGEKLIVHRIIRIIKEGGKYMFETKGDNRLESDAETDIGAYLVGEDDLRGLVIGVVYH